MKNIIFVEPKSELPSPLGDLSWTKSLPMLGTLYLGSILSNNGYDVKVYKEGLKEADYSNLDCDFLCLYSMTSTFPRAVKIAYEYKKNNPDGKVIIGGPHVTFLPEDALNLRYNGNYLIDHVVIGEAENVIIDIINNKYKERLIRGSPVKDLDNLPKINFSLLQGLKKNNDLFPISTSRGCPYSCSFCSVTKMFGRGYRFRSTNLVVEDILDMEKNYKFSSLFFYDDNLFANHLRGKKLLKEMADRNIKKAIFAQTRIDVAKDDELLKLLGDASNNVILFFGLESINDKTLDMYNKRQTFIDIKNAIKKIKDYGYRIMGAFVFGSDEDDKNTIKKTSDFCDDVGIDFPQFTVLTPLPGTDLYYELEKQNRIFTKDWGLYDVAHVVYKPLKMKASDLQEGFVNAYKRAYSCTNKRLLNYFIRNLRDFRWTLGFRWVNLRRVVKRALAEESAYVERLRKLNL